MFPLPLMTTLPSIRALLTNHINVSHESMSDFPCFICSLGHPTYRALSAHQFDHHEEGIFRCSKRECPYLGTNRSKVYRHIGNEHSQKHICPFDGCAATFVSLSNLRKHQSTHSQVKPFICRYPDCTGYAATTKTLILAHIRMVHFKLPQTKKKQLEMGIVDERDPNDFIEMVPQQFA